MITKTTLNELKKETLLNVQKILSKDIQDELPYDKIIKFQLKTIMVDKNKPNTLIYPNLEDLQGLLLSKLVSFLSLLLNMNDNERYNLYVQSIYTITDEKIMEIINEIRLLENFDMDIKNNLIKIFELISDKLDKKKDFTLDEYINSIFLKLAFIPQLEPLLKFKIYSLVIEYYLSQYGVIPKYEEEEINITEETSLSLIMDLLSKEKIDNEVLVLSIIILNYNSLRDNIMKLTPEKIKAVIISVAEKSKNIEKNTSIIEKIISMFLDEIEMPEKIKKKRRNKKKKKNQDNYDKDKENQEKENQEEKNDENKKDEIIIINNENEKKNKIKEDVSLGKNDIIKFKNIEFGDKNYNFKNNIINLFNDISKKIGNIDIKNDLDEFKKILFSLADENIEIKENIEALTKDNKDMKNKIKILTNENKQIKKKIEELNNENGETREILGEIQLRDLSKNFLNHVKHYLIDNNIDVSNIGTKSKGEEYSKKIGELFSNVDKKKLSIIQNLIKNSSEFANEEDLKAQSLFLENYEDFIEDYKEKKKLDTMINPEIFCFLICLGIIDKDFEESFDFLGRFFNKNLKVKNKDIDVFKAYFK